MKRLLSFLLIVFAVTITPAFAEQTDGWVFEQGSNGTCNLFVGDRPSMTALGISNDQVVFVSVQDTYSIQVIVAVGGKVFNGVGTLSPNGLNTYVFPTTNDALLNALKSANEVTVIYDVLGVATMVRYKTVNRDAFKQYQACRNS